ncbi:MAG: hypothetical protein K9N47_05625 [Prosthecobacter sp.]|uniref:hypothetical protein n=1 Tax=Prosthecobacter sp. TaxID=1965333 RepID=UPI0025D6E362|nr:hypothetical protein [Prosthecobacter sp.]MCF7785580.1 hypothetical protein [Prosthecobacter sp.]
MKTLLIVAIIALPLSMHADDQPKHLRTVADALESVFNNTGASPEQIKKAQEVAIETLRSAAHSLEQKDKMIAVQEKMIPLATKGHDFSDGKSVAVPRAGKDNEYESLTLKNGTMYQNVKVLSSDATTLKFSHDGGIATVSLIDVPEKMGVKYIKVK